MGDHDGHSGCGGGGVPDVDCFELVRQLYVYLDGELTEERREEIAVHLDECGPCADAAGFEAELRAVISSRCKDRVPDSLIDRVAATIAAEEARQSSGAGGTGGAGGAGEAAGGGGGAGEAAGGGGGAGGSGTPGAGPGSAPA